jgi:hypothetical protein
MKKENARHAYLHNPLFIFLTFLQVFFELNGHMRSMLVVDAEASKTIVVRPKAIPSVKGSSNTNKSDYEKFNSEI